MASPNIAHDVYNRLLSLGYSFKSANDNWLMDFCTSMVEKSIRTETNQKDMPEGLHYVAVDMICGEFLKSIKTTANAENLTADINTTVLKQKSQGDTSFTFDTSSTLSPEARLDALIDHLINGRRHELKAFRRFKW